MLRSNDSAVTIHVRGGSDANELREGIGRSCYCCVRHFSLDDLSYHGIHLMRSILYCNL